MIAAFQLLCRGLGRGLLFEEPCGVGRFGASSLLRRGLATRPAVAEPRELCLCTLCSNATSYVYQPTYLSMIFVDFLCMYYRLDSGLTSEYQNRFCCALSLESCLEAIVDDVHGLLMLLVHAFQKSLTNSEAIRAFSRVQEAQILAFLCTHGRHRRSCGSYCLCPEAILPGA